MTLDVADPPNIKFDLYLEMVDYRMQYCPLKFGLVLELLQTNHVCQTDHRLNLYSLISMIINLLGSVNPNYLNTFLLTAMNAVKNIEVIDHIITLPH